MAPHGGAVLVVDNDEALCNSVCNGLTGEGYACDTARSASQALLTLARWSFDVALLEVTLPGGSGIELLRLARTSLPRTAIIMLTGLREVDTAVEVMKLGAVDYIVKPFAIERVILSVGQALQAERTGKWVAPPKNDLWRKPSDCTYGTSFDRIDAIAYGVEAQVDYFDFHSQTVIERTVELAQRLGFSRRDIEKWRRARDQVVTERNHHVASALSKLEGNLAVPVLMGLVRSLNGSYLERN